MRAPSLTDTLSVLLPTAEETLFLTACLHSGDAARVAFDRWLQAVGSAGKALAGKRSYAARFLPLLFASSLRNEFRLAPQLRSLVRTAHVREEWRGRMMRRVAEQALSSIREAGIDVVVLKGAALAESVYGGWTARHLDGIDLLVRKRDLDRSARHLRNQGFRPTRTKRWRRRAGFSLRHDLGVAVALHDRLFRDPRVEIPIEAVWNRAPTRAVAGVPVKVLAPCDVLLHVCGQAACTASRETLQWVSDAWGILGRHPDLDWDGFLAAAGEARLSLPLSVLLAYLSRQIEAPIPHRVLDSLARQAARSDVREREAALYGALQGSRGGLAHLLSATNGVGAKAWVLRRVLFPSAEQRRALRAGRNS